MKHLLYLEDLESDADDLLRRVGDQLNAGGIGDVNKIWVPYVDGNGTPRDPEVVASLAVDAIAQGGKTQDSDRFVFVVDLIQHPNAPPKPDYGLQVIQALGRSLRPGRPLAEFLQDRQYLALLFTAYEVSDNDIMRVWHIPAKVVWPHGASPKQQDESAHAALAGRSEQHTIVRVLKLVNEPMIGTLALQWLK